MSHATASTWVIAVVVATVLAGCGSASGGDDGAADAEETSSRGSGSLVVLNGTLLDGAGGDPVPDAVVVVEQGVITEVGAAQDVVPPDDATVVDAGGGTILPGLVDTHVHHLARLRVVDGVIDGPGASLSLTAPLQAGVTTYRDLGSPFGDAASVTALREALASWGPGAPTVMLAGPLLAAPGNHALEEFADQARAVADVGEARSAVTDLADAGVDQIKLLLDSWTELLPDPTPTLTPEQAAAVVDAAHDRGLRVVAHVSDLDEARTALAAGVDELTHWPGEEPLPDALLAEIVARDVPVGTTFGIITPAPGEVRRLLDAGGTIVLSSDAPGLTPTLSISLELQRMVDAGMTPMEVIVASTAAAARAIELDEVLGTLTPGKEGDLVVVAGDPLADIAAMGDVTAVINDGVVVHAPE